MLVNLESICFKYTQEELGLFTDDQKRYWKHIIESYQLLKKECLDGLEMPISTSHKKWISARVNQHMTTSVMRLLYLTESFCEASSNFNAVAAAIHIKAMAEIPMHLGYVTWILSENRSFDEIRSELHKLTFGKKDPKTGLASSGLILQKDLYTRSDQMLKKFFPDDVNAIDLMETIYREANATGHHNYMAHNMLTGLKNKEDIWHQKDRKEMFVFYSNNIFQWFLSCDVILGTTRTFVDAIKHYLKQLPENFTK